MGIVQGSGVDTHLNTLGQQQAAAFYEAYADVFFDKVYTSSLKRSQESVKGFLEKGIPHQIFSGLDEINWGDKEGQKLDPKADAYYFNILQSWSQGKTNLPIDGGESPEDVLQRMVPVVDYIKAQESEKTILICMHGRAMRILLCYLLQCPLREMDQFEHANLGLYLLDYADGAFHLQRGNDTAHLRSLS